MVNTHIKDQLDRNTPIPLYFQISEILRREIDDGKYQPGENIPTEAELQKYYQVSRATIRQAISQLVFDGLLERKRSQGTKVSSGKLEATLENLKSFTNEMMSASANLTTRILTFKIIPPPETVARILEMDPNEQVAWMERVRIVDEKPIAIEHWYASQKYFPGIQPSMFKETGMEQSTYYILFKYYNININRAEDTVSAAAVEAREARILDVEPGQAVLQRTRISYSAEDQPVSYATGMYLIHLKFSLNSNR